MTTTVDGQPVDQEKINRQLEQVMKALDSGDIAAAVGYLDIWKKLFRSYQWENQKFI